MFDLVLAITGLVILLPVWLIAAVRIKHEDGGPLLYRAQRIGRTGHEFTLLKFRTMVMNADRIGGPSTAGDDPRLLHCAAFLRRYKIDEVPQLLNVIKGDMSIVGPRPEVRFYTDMYSAEERRILSVRPGITDRASIRFRNEGEILRGAADPEEAYMRLIRPEKIRLGLRYVDHGSFLEDLAIIAATIRAVIRPDSFEGAKR